jgi:hypothetical protein
MSSNLTTSVEEKSTNTSETKPREMTVDEFAELVSKWHQTYYAWNTSCVTYYKYFEIVLKKQVYVFLVLV